MDVEEEGRGDGKVFVAVDVILQLCYCRQDRKKGGGGNKRVREQTDERATPNCFEVTKYLRREKGGIVAAALHLRR